MEFLLMLLIWLNLLNLGTFAEPTVPPAGAPEPGAWSRTADALPGFPPPGP